MKRALFVVVGCFMLSILLPMCDRTPESGDRPEVTYMSPKDLATDVQRNTDIRTNFTKPMNTTLTKEAFDIDPPATGTFVWSDDNKSLVFQPDSDLQPNTTYTVTMSAMAESQDGWKLEAERSATWTTGS